MQVTAWIMLFNFVRNCKQKKYEQLAGPLTTPETDKAVHFFIYFFYSICHRIITKNIGKEEKKEVARRPNRHYRGL